MANMKKAPAPIKRKLLLTCIVGTACLFVGLSMSLLLRDRMMLFLSLAVCVLSYGKAAGYFRVISREEYEVIEGTCIAVMPKPLRKYRKIRIIDDNGNESTLLLGKQSKIKIGYRYRFYFKETLQLSLGSEYFNSALSSDCFLGYEELGEFASTEAE